VTPVEIGGFESRAATTTQDFQSFGRVRLYRGIGKKFYGKSHYEHDPEIEEFDTTFWFVFLFFPLIPLRSYRIRRRFRARWNIFGSKTYQVVHRLPMKWGQVLFTWIKAAVVMLVLRFLGLIFIEYLRRQTGP
jgi:hypothetical protein